VAIYEVSIPITSKHRRGERATASLGLSEKLELNKRFVLDVKISPDGSKSLIAVIEVEGRTGDEARFMAIERAKGYLSLVGLETRVGTILEDDSAVVREIRPPEVKTESSATQVHVYDSVTLGDSVHLEAMPSTGHLRAIYERYEQIASSSKVALIPLIELYNLAWHEQFDRSRFLTLVSTLEALLPPAEPIPGIAVLVKELQKSFPRKRFRLRRKRSAEDEASERRLGQLRSRLGDLRNESISDRMRKLVSSLRLPFESPEKVADKIYRLRSTLVHDYLQADVQEISQRIEEAFTIAEAGLKRALGIEETS
jgi:hypothetical protein